MCQWPAEDKVLSVIPEGISGGHPGTHCPISVFVATGHLYSFLCLCPSREWHSLESEDPWAHILGSWVTSDWGLTLFDSGLAHAFPSMLESDG